MNADTASLLTGINNRRAAREESWKTLVLAKWGHAELDKLVMPLVDAGCRDVSVAIVALGEALTRAEARMRKRTQGEEQ